jgi:hypothetical protein
MSIEISKSQFGIEFLTSVTKAIWINANGHGGDFTVEVALKTWKDQATKDANGEAFPVENIVLPMNAENKADLDIISAAAYRMLHREARFAGGKKV